jgi:hypothetical protein
VNFSSVEINSFVGKSLIGRTFSTLTTWLSVWVFISLLLYIKIPSASTKIYAEDGLALQTALEKSFPNDFLLPYAGYLDIVWRSGGRFAALFPLQDAAQAIFLFNTLMLAWISITIYRASSEFIHHKISRSVLSLSLILLPIAGFESIANSTNLHFLFMSACLPIFLRKNLSGSGSYQFSLFILVATLSTPLLIFYFPLIVFIRMSSRSSRWCRKPNLVESAWFVGILIQVVFILTRAFGDRTSSGVNSIAKSGYLYLDRVVGSTFFPGWGDVSKSTQPILPDLFSTQVYLGLRAALALIILFLFVMYLLNKSRENSELRVLATGVLLTGLIYWFVVGVFFNPEPRYAIFPSFGMLVVIFFIQGSNSKPEIFNPNQRALIVLVCLTWIGSWSPSMLRVSGPTWSDEFQQAQAKCLSGVVGVRIPIIPTNLDWYVDINCDKLLSD